MDISKVCSEVVISMEFVLLPIKVGKAVSAQSAKFHFTKKGMYCSRGDFARTGVQ